MKREIAREIRGNFRGACPTIGRLEMSVPSARVEARISPRSGMKAGFEKPADFMGTE
jgi:hypothetical protein